MNIKAAGSLLKLAMNNPMGLTGAVGRKTAGRVLTNTMIPATYEHSPNALWYAWKNHKLLLANAIKHDTPAWQLGRKGDEYLEYFRQLLHEQKWTLTRDDLRNILKNRDVPWRLNFGMKTRGLGEKAYDPKIWKKTGKLSFNKETRQGRDLIREAMDTQGQHSVMGYFTKTPTGYFDRWDFAKNTTGLTTAQTKYLMRNLVKPTNIDDFIKQISYKSLMGDRMATRMLVPLRQAQIKGYGTNKALINSIGKRHLRTALDKTVKPIEISGNFLGF